MNRASMLASPSGGVQEVKWNTRDFDLAAAWRCGGKDSRFFSRVRAVQLNGCAPTALGEAWMARAG